MSWSNVLDYMHPADFHTLARACSKSHGTTHYGYSMNWLCRVFGTSLLDFEFGEDKNKSMSLIQHARVETEKTYKTKPKTYPM